MYVVWTHQNRLDEAILMSTHDIQFIIKLGYQENFLGTQKRIRISHGKRAIGVRVIEVLLYLKYCWKKR